MTKQVPTRQACFALISAIEQDLRGLLRGRKAGALLTGETKEKAARRAKAAGLRDSDLDENALLDYADFADIASGLRLADKDEDRDSVLAAADTVERVSPARNRVCHSRPLEPEDFVTILEATDTLIRMLGTSTMSQATTTRDRLTKDPTFVFSLAIPEYWREDGTKPDHNLPLPKFDDTRFLGRSRDRKEVLKHLLSAHPVITIVGEGGIGKTALALRCLYDLVDLGDRQPYDYIVWVSLKASVLTAAGIVSIKDAITDSLGLFRTAAKAMGVPAAHKKLESELLAEIAEYLQSFKVLLAIDNLETINTETIRELVLNLPQGSKLLLTSRIGMGEFELRYPLGALTSGEAKGLMRRYAQTLNLQPLLKYPETLVDRFVQVLFGNPLLIKWFVSGIMAGGTPEQIVFGKKRTFEQALSFCFENLFERLDDTSRKLLHVIAAARRPATRGELLLLADVLPEVLDASLTMLHNSSILRRQLLGEATAFSLTDIAEKYLSKVAPPDPELMIEVSTRLREVRVMAETNRVGQAAYKYEWTVIEFNARDVDQLIAASFLRRAVAAERKRRLAEAEELVRQAQEIDPEFSETYRVLAGIEMVKGRMFAAEQALEQAIERGPNSAKARYARSMLFLERSNDVDRALEDIEVALSLDPEDPTLETAKARILVRLGRYVDAEQLYNKLLKGLSGRPRRWRIITRDQASELFRRMLEKDGEMDDEDAFIQHFGAATMVLREGYDRHDWDEKTKERLARIFDEGTRYALFRKRARAAVAIIDDLARWAPDVRAYLSSIPPLQRLINDRSPEMGLADTSALVPKAGSRPEGPADEDVLESGVVDKLLAGYGFVADRKNGRYFFHRSDLHPTQKWADLHVGDTVCFRLVATEKGPKAGDLRRV